MPEETKAPPIVIDLRPYGERMEFETVEAVEKWVAEERAGWEPLFSKLGRGGSAPAISAAQNVINQRLGLIDQSIQQHRQKKVPPLPEQTRSEFIAQMESQFPVGKRNETYISSKSAAAARAHEIAEKEPEQAAFFLVILLKAAWHNRNLHVSSIYQSDPTPLFAGLVDAELFKRGIEGVDAERSALTQLRQEWLDELANHKQRYETEIKAARDDIEGRRRVEQDHDQTFARTIKDAARSFGDAVNAAKQQFATLSATYDSQLSLKASVQYWRRRAWITSGVTAGLLLAIAGAGTGLVLYLDYIIESLLPVVAGTTPPAPAPSGASIWIRYAIAPITFILGAWFIRMLSRLLYSNYQSATTAFEKATMVQSFLALMRDASGLPPGAINILLSAIYHQPSGTASAEPMLEPEMAGTAAEALSKIK